MLKKHFAKFLLGIVFSSVLIYLTLRQINFSDFLELLKNANYYILVLAGALYVFCYILRGIRYYFIILPLKKTKIFENLPYTIIGFFVNNILPLRMGEFVRAKITGERLGISRSSVFATIVIERILDILVFILLFLTIMFFIPFPEFVKKSFYILAGVSSFCAAIFFVMLFRGSKMLKILLKFPLPAKFQTFASSLFNKFTDGLLILKRPLILSKTFTASLLVWACEIIFFLVVAFACDIKISFWGAAFTVIIIGVGIVLPAAPGYVGVFEFAGIVALKSLGIDENPAFVCIALYHCLEIIIIFLMGFICFFKAKISMSNLFKFSKIEE